MWATTSHPLRFSVLRVDSPGPEYRVCVCVCGASSGATGSLLAQATVVIRGACGTVLAWCGSLRCWPSSGREATTQHSLQSVTVSPHNDTALSSTRQACPNPHAVCHGRVRIRSAHALHDAIKSFFRTPPTGKMIYTRGGGPSRAFTSVIVLQ